MTNKVITLVGLININWGLTLFDSYKNYENKTHFLIGVFMKRWQGLFQEMANKTIMII